MSRDLPMLRDKMSKRSLSPSLPCPSSSFSVCRANRFCGWTGVGDESRDDLESGGMLSIEARAS